MNSFMLIFLPFFLVGLFRTVLKAVYGWQRKEYLFYRMKDFLGSREGQKFWWNRSYWIKTIFLFTAGLSLVIFGRNNFKDYLFWEAIIFVMLDSAELFWSIKKKTFRYPKPTSKALLLILLNLILIFLPALSITLKYDNLNGVDAWLLFGISAWLLSAADLIFSYVSIILIYPFDHFAKKKVYRAAEKHRKSLENLKVITISGSYGKTTTKEILYQLLKDKYRVEKTEKNQNADVAVARKILSLKPETEVFICEIGTYKIGLGAQICRMARPNYAIITGLDEQHYNLFGSRENIVKAESESLDFLEKNDFAAINWDSEMCHEIEIPKEIEIVKYGVENKNTDSTLKNLKLDYPETEFNFRNKKFKTNLVSKGNIQNLLGALEVAVQVGLELDEAQKAVKKFELPDSTLNFEEKKWGFLIDDSRNINPSGVKNALETMKIFKDYQKIVVLDEIPELGKETDKIHKKMAWQLADLGPDFVFLLGESFNPITYQELLKQGFSKDKIFFCADSEKAEYRKKIEKMVKTKKTILLLEGWRAKFFSIGCHLET